MTCLIVAIVVIAVIAAVYFGAWVLCRIAARADSYQLHQGKPPSEWR